MGMASLELLDGGAPRYRRTIQLQPEIPSWVAHVGRVLGFLTLHRGGPPFVFGHFLLLRLLLGDHFPLLGYLILLPFLLQVGDGEQADNRRRKRGRGGAGRGGDSEMPLFLSVRNSFIPFFLFKAISSLSFELLSTRAVTRPGVRTLENLLSSSSESETRTTSSFGFSPFSSKWNWSISALSDRREEVVSSLRTATSRGERWKGSSIGRRSSQARKLGIETSIRASRGLPTLIAWPTS